MKIWGQLCQLGLLGLVCAMPAKAQIVPDSSVGTVVTPNVMIQGVTSDRIDGGAIRGANLFHSFQQFNIQSGRGAYFSNPAGITNILSRVTGSNPSNINGILGVLGNANLFLLNPNGIVFGAGARLDLNSSFIATTANSINFADGIQFSASNPQATPLLSVSVPVGLGLGSNPGAIQVQGTGHNLTLLSAFSPYIGAGASSTGLRVKPGNTLALVGGDVTLVGGILTAPQGRIELGGGADGVVSLTPTGQGWSLGYGGVQSFRDIRLSQKALVDTSGAAGGDIQLVGRRVALTDNSVALMQNQGWQPSGNLSVNASESLSLKYFSSLTNETLGVGKGGDVVISTPQLTIEDGSGINTIAFGAADGGNLSVNAADSIQVTGFLPSNPTFVSVIATVTFGSGTAGNLTISTGRLKLLNGGSIEGITFGTGSGGNVKINATDLIEIRGVATSLVPPSSVSAPTARTGNAGTVTINTTKLTVQDGGKVYASISASGKAGTVTINASESVEVNGTIPGSLTPSFVGSSADIVTPFFRQLFGLPPVPSGASGDVTINTGRLSVNNNGLISVRNEGIGNGGTVRVNARSITLDNKGSITAATASGQGGNIALQAQNLQLRHGSAITATAGGTRAMVATLLSMPTPSYNLRIAISRLMLFAAGVGISRLLLRASFRQRVKLRPLPN